MFVKIIGLSPSSNFINVSLRIENTSLESVCLTTCVVKSRIYDAYDIFSKSINVLENELIISILIRVDTPCSL